VIDDRSKSFDLIQRMAMPLAKSGLFAATFDQAIARMLLGEALGIAPIVAMQQVHIIEGKPVMSSNLMLTIARNRGWRHSVKVRTDKACVISWTDPRGVTVGESSFTIEEAQRIKHGKEGKTLADKDNYKNYAADMLFARAISRGIRTYAPEVTSGIPVYTTEESQDFEAAAPAKPQVLMPSRKTEEVA
jgi:hypothetical protein